MAQERCPEAGLEVGGAGCCTHVLQKMRYGSGSCQGRRMMDDINWQTGIKLIVEKTIKERKKQRILARA